METIKQAMLWVLPRLPLPMLALAASYGVYQYQRLYMPHWFALASAVAFELTYIGLALAPVHHQERQQARWIALSAVGVSVVYNTLAGLFHRVPTLLNDLPLPWEAVLAVLHGAPLAIVAYFVADLLLHRDPDAQQDDGSVITITEDALAILRLRLAGETINRDRATEHGFRTPQAALAATARLYAALRRDHEQMMSLYQNQSV
ncbi:MAG: hypothetical protein HC837_01480 [Chloroflexaceae bacterium]|nr:hypothetical protein [Chloroflexaceae bacterium]